ncbi:MAG: aminotransferase class V-fold PLP-dependent enzyme [Glaciecola sp.]
MSVSKQIEDNYRDFFHLPKGIYALSHSVGAMTKLAGSKLQNDYLYNWQTQGGDAWPMWLASIERYCDQVAAICNVNGDDICPQTSLSSGFSAFLTAIAKLPQHKHQRVILMHEDAFASMGFVVTALAHTYQLELVLIKGNPNQIDNWLSAFEQHSVLACLITHVHSNTSVRSDVSAICALAKQFEAFALVDVAQSIGIVPVDIPSWQADAVFGSCVKWLCGGPGAGFMWVSNTLIGYLHPDPVGWFSHQNPFEFDINHYQAHQGIKRFWGGTPSVAPYVCAAASIEQLRNIGLTNINQHNVLLKQYVYSHIADNVKSLPYQSDISQLGGSLCVAPHALNQTVNKLTQAGVKFDQRGETLRLSLHVSNTREDAETIINCFI